MKKVEIYLNIEALTLDDIKNLTDAIGFNIDQITEYPMLVFTSNSWNQVGIQSPLLGIRQEVNLSEFYNIIKYQ